MRNFAAYLLLLILIVAAVIAFTLGKRGENAGTYSKVDSLVAHNYIKVTDTIVKPYKVVDTLVIIETSEMDTAYVDTTNLYAVSGGWYMGSMNHFADGKTIDTDYRHVVHTTIIHKKDKPQK